MACGKFLAINAANMSCACPRSPQGLSPLAHLGDGASDLILIRKCSRLNFLRYLIRLTNQSDQVPGSAGCAGATRATPCEIRPLASPAPTGSALERTRPSARRPPLLLSTASPRPAALGP